MNLTRKFFQLSVPHLALQSSGLVILLALAHTVSDAVTNMLSALLPTIQIRFVLTETTLALLVATLSLSALLTQPLFGALADRVGHQRIAVLGILFDAILFSLIGIVPNVNILSGLILVGGLGWAALHPAIVSMARTTGGQKPELALGLFSAGGTLGVAVGPILVMILLANLGLSFTPWLMIPGLLFGVLLLVLSPDDIPFARSAPTKILDLRLLLGPVGVLALTGILGNVAFVTFTSAMPLWLVHAHGLRSDSSLISWTLSAFSLSVAAGGIAGGIISNRLGTKRLIIGSLLLAGVPLYSIFLLTPGTFSYFVAVGLAGVLLNAGMPMLIVAAQDLSPKAAATASGMLMGFSAGIAGLMYVLVGQLQASLGLAPSMAIGYVSLFVAVLIATAAIKPRPAHEERSVEKLSCLCSPCMEQNVGAYPQWMSSI